MNFTGHFIISDCSPSRQIVEKSYGGYKYDRTITDNAERPGRQKEVMTPKNIKKVVTHRKAKLVYS